MVRREGSVRGEEVEFSYDKGVVFYCLLFVFCLLCAVLFFVLLQVWDAYKAQNVL